MIHNLTGGGGAALNYKVVGGTSEPTGAAENTIWVNTDTGITSHVFASTEPESPAEGMMWFLTSLSAAAQFNAFKKNGLWVYPTAAQQYISGAWVKKDAITYQNGAWVNWVTYLYNKGDLCSALTGGWDDYLKDNGSGTMTKSADHLLVKGVNNEYYGSGSTTNKINLTEYSTLHVLAKKSGSGTCVVGLAASRTAVDDAFKASVTVTKTSYAEVTLDISSYATSYYVVLGVNSTANLYVQQIWLT